MKELHHFTAAWSSICKEMETEISNFISENPEIKYTKIDISEDMTLLETKSIKTMPTFISFKDSLELSRHVGQGTKEELSALFLEAS
jgi:thioredoxin-like negative regulator of GroEL